MEEKFKLDIKKRPRRLRKSQRILDLCRESEVRPSNLILPVFIKEGKKGSEEIPSMPGISRHTIDSLLRECEKCLSAGVGAIAPFPNVNPKYKSKDASESLNSKSLANRAIEAVKKHFPEIVVIADIALDPYTSHGHDGILNDRGDWILNDETVEILAGMSLMAAHAGADFVAPSDMMDGRIGAIREALDECGFTDTAIMAYSAKYASCMYSPFRDAIGSAPKGGKVKYLDKRGYQLSPTNSREAMKEIALDEEEGADVLMVKPAGWYLDIVSEAKKRSNLPIAAYQVSGEYSMIMAAVKNGWLDLERAKRESLDSIKRAGADMILTYFAI